MRSAFIPVDGFNLTGTIPATADRPGLKFNFRPATGAARRRFLNTDPANLEAVAGDLFVNQVKDRTVTILAEDANTPQVLTAAQFNQLDPDLWTGVLNRILGFGAPDPN